MAGIRLTGLTSGLDTESLVAELSKAYQTKIDNVTKNKTKAEWKKEAWGTLNTKLMNFYKGALSDFKSTGTYTSKAVNGTLTGLTVTAGSKAAAGTHKVQVNATASAQMWTGYKINENKYTATSYTEATDATTKIADLRDSKGNSVLNSINGASFKLTDTESGQETEVKVNIGADATVEDLLQNINDQLTGTGVTASFEKGKLQFTNNTATELTNDTGDTTYSGGKNIILTAADEASAAALGLNYKADGSGTVMEPLSDANKKNTVSANAFLYTENLTPDTNVTGSSKLVDLGIAAGTVIKVNGTEIAVDRTMTLSKLATEMGKAGINASYDAGQGRFYLSAKDTGTANAFTVEASDAAALDVLGLNLADDYAGKIDATDAEITYNGVKYTQASNNFNINGLTISATKAGEEQTFSVDTDVDGIYNKVKNFVKEYNSLIAEMNKLYSAKSAKGYDPLTSDEKEAMSDDEVEKWETTIKDSLLRRDSTISSLLTSMRTTLNKSVEVANSDGTTSRFALSSFGIVTGTYTENGQLHIQGDSEDSDYSAQDDKLKAAIMANPDAVTKTLTSLGNEMYENLRKAMKKTETSSALTFYNDVTMDEEIDDYKDDIKKLQSKLEDEQDRYYSQFSAMETALAKLQSQQSYVSQLFGG